MASATPRNTQTIDLIRLSICVFRVSWILLVLHQLFPKLLIVLHLKTPFEIKVVRESYAVLSFGFSYSKIFLSFLFKLRTWPSIHPSIHPSLHPSINVDWSWRTVLNPPSHLCQLAPVKKIIASIERIELNSALWEHFIRMMGFADTLLYASKKAKEQYNDACFAWSVSVSVSCPAELSPTMAKILL